MRSSLLARGVSATAAILLLTACGGGSDEDSASPTSSSAASSSAAETTSEAPEASSEFCSQAEDFGNEISSSFESTDPQQLTDNLKKAADGVRAIEPPDEIADDWQALADGLEKVAGTLEGADPNDPQVAAKVQSDLQAIQEPATNVETYLQEQCGIDTSESASPSS